MFGRKQYFDPIKFGYFERGTPLTHRQRIVQECPDCGSETNHDDYEAVLGLHVGFALPFGRKSTAGKLGKRSHWRFCSQCGVITPLDEEAEKEMMKSMKKFLG